MGQAVAYLRKSKVTSDRHVSWEVQEAQVRELASRHGHSDLQLLSDWGRSGRGDKTRLRAGYAHLKEVIAEGGIDALYSYSLSRLARSLSEYHTLVELCRDKGVVIRLCKEGEFDYGSASGRLIVNILASVAQMEAELAQERARDTVALRRSRGDHIGRPPYGFRVVDGEIKENPEQPVAPVLDAYREAGSFHGAARLLNASDLRSRHGGLWNDTAVRAIVRRTASEDLAPSVRATKPGTKGRGTQLLFQLLHCHCGATMTPTQDRVRDYGPYISYACWRARHDASHPRPHKVSERRLLPWVMEEASRLGRPTPFR